MTASRRQAALRLLVSLGLLAALAAWLDPSAIAAQLRDLSPGWVLVALALSLPQVLVSAWRWRLTARLLGVPLPRRTAIGDYYLATFLNQLLPGGVMGDVARAWRHASTSGERGPAVRAVIIERASGQLVLWVLAGVALLSPTWREPLSHAATALAEQRDTLGLPGATALGLAVLLGVIGLWRVMRRPPRALRGLGSDLKRALIDAAAWPGQLLGSLLVVVSYVAIYLCAARAIGVDLAMPTLLVLVPPVLMAMALPLSVAGWGLREGAAALVWGATGLDPAQGVAVSMAYGILVLMSSLPGALFLLRHRSGVEQSQVEQGVVAAGEGPHRRASRLVEGVDGRQRQARSPGADQQRRHQQVQTMQHVGLDEARHGDPAALDQYPRQAPRREGVEDRARVDAIGPHGQFQALDVLPGANERRCAPPHQMQGGRGGGLEHAEAGVEPATRVEDHPPGAGTLDMAHRELRVVGRHGAGADQHCVDQGPQTMQMHAAGQAVDVMRRPAPGGDAPVEALPQLGDRQAPAAGHQRQQAVEQRTRGGRPGEIAGPAAAAPDLELPGTGIDTGGGRA